jgi:hypothetical protein
MIAQSTQPIRAAGPWLVDLGLLCVLVGCGVLLAAVVHEVGGASERLAALVGGTTALVGYGALQIELVRLVAELVALSVTVAVAMGVGILLIDHLTRVSVGR